MATKITKCGDCGAEIKRVSFKSKGKTFIFTEKNCICDIKDIRNAKRN